LIAQRQDRRMQTQLQNRKNPFARVFFDIGKAVNVPWIEHQRLFTNRVSTGAKRKAAMRIMQIIRRANSDIIKPLAFTLQFIDMAIKALEFSKEMRVRKMAI